MNANAEMWRTVRHAISCVTALGIAQQMGAPLTYIAVAAPILTLCALSLWQPHTANLLVHLLKMLLAPPSDEKQATIEDSSHADPDPNQFVAKQAQGRSRNETS
jgi:hypothetical protein